MGAALDKMIKLAGLPPLALSYPVDTVRQVFYDTTRATSANKGSDSIGPGVWIKEQYNDFLIVEDESKGSAGASLFQVPFTVDDSGLVTFGEWKPVKQQYVPDTVATTAASDGSEIKLAADEPPSSHGFDPSGDDKGCGKDGCGKGPAAAIHKGPTGKPLPWAKK